jgi:RimK family alpha-L-glutamate ligase
MTQKHHLRPLRGIILCTTTTEPSYSLKRFYEAALTKNIELQVLSPQQFELVVTQTDKKSVLIDEKLQALPDFVLPRMGSSTSFYAFSVLRQLQNLGVYICNTPAAIYSVKDKLLTHQMIAQSLLNTPKTMLAKPSISVAIVEREIGFPLIIKNVAGTNGNGIYLCESADKFQDVMELIYTNSPDANIIVQEFIASSKGTDLRVFTLGTEVVACMQRSATSGFKANVAKGAEVSFYPITDTIRTIGKQTAELFKLDIAGIDLLFEKDGSFKVCEVNSSPGFEGLEKVTGHVIAEKILDYIRFKVESHQSRNQSTMTDFENIFNFDC